MQAAAATARVEAAIQSALADESTMVLNILAHDDRNQPPFTVIDARRIIACLQENPIRFDTLKIFYFRLSDVAVLNAFRNGLPLCTSIVTITLHVTNSSNEGQLDRLLPAFFNTSVTTLCLSNIDFQGQQGGGEAIRDLLAGNDTLLNLSLTYSRIGPEVAIGVGKGFAFNCRLLKLTLWHCSIGNDGLVNLLPVDGIINNSLMELNLSGNNIEGAEGGRNLSLLLQRFPSLKVICLADNRLGPLGADALAPGLVAASHLESLELHHCGLGNDGVANLVPDGQVNRSLTNLNLRYNNIQGTLGGENVIALVARCTNLDRFDFLTGQYSEANTPLNPDQCCCLDLLLERKRLVTVAQTLAGSTFPILFQFMEKAHRHEHGLDSIFVILQNDGDDYFCNANNRAIE